MVTNTSHLRYMDKDLNKRLSLRNRRRCERVLLDLRLTATDETRGSLCERELFVRRNIKVGSGKTGAMLKQGMVHSSTCHLIARIELILLLPQRFDVRSRHSSLHDFAYYPGCLSALRSSQQHAINQCSK